MTNADDSMMLQKKVVVVFDICSSSKILEDLLRTENQKKWRNLLIQIKNFLVNKANSLNFEIYKFLGDGWILLFEESVCGGELIEFLKELSLKFTSEYDKKIKEKLEAPPEIIGLTIGIDRGTLIRIVMNTLPEYIGRPLNVAARLQGAVKNDDNHPQNKVLISSHYYSDIKLALPDDVETIATSKELRNISHQAKIKCYKISLFPNDEHQKRKRMSRAGRILKKMNE